MGAVTQVYVQARVMHTENPPSGMTEYLKKWEEFFDDYAAQVDRWHQKNSSYHKAIASLANYPQPLLNWPTPGGHQRGSSLTSWL
jgi:hypothetical protein